MTRSQRHLFPLAATCLAFAASIFFAQSVGAGGVVPQPKMGDPLLGLTPEQLARFDVGRVQFTRVFTVAEGLGPIFNEKSCGSCHVNPVGGPGSVTVTRAGMATKDGFDPLAELGGSLFQQDAISDECAEVVPPEANVVALRVTNGMLGYGLVQAIPDGDISSLADPDDANGDFISGRVNLVGAVEDPKGRPPSHVGRFGWKAHAADMMSFSAGAALFEIGITNPFLTEDLDPNGINPPELADCDTVPDPEIGLDFIEQLDDFQRFIAAPPQTPRSGMSGEVIFDTIGCTLCHTPSFTAANDPLLEDAIRNKVVKPYSDFLLHDVGQAADFIEQGMAGARELKSAPLMGLRTRDPLWHDGRFAGDTFENRVTTAILEHGALGSESLDSGVFDKWQALSPAFKSLLIAFLDSLGRIEFDADGDNDVQLDDFVAFAACFTGPGDFYTPDDPCAISDIDQDGDVDLTDYSSFLLAYFGPFDDCNNNGVLDLTDIITAASPDDNANGIPDECETVGDLDGDGVVGILDLLILLSDWGPCKGCPADLDGDGNVGILDLLLLLSNWG
ncbi:MAG: hypothetical protein IH988_05900 [Planctomycetes bacterium]|nr:hypothetical protein [Planctomycetota bacterium]